MEAIELINLTLNEIRRSAQTIADLEKEYRHLVFFQENTHYAIESIVFNTKAADKLHDVLERCRIALRDVLEDVAECQNNRDMLTPVDVAIGEVAYDLIYERKTEKDYDN